MLPHHCGQRQGYPWLFVQNSQHWSPITPRHGSSTTPEKGLPNSEGKQKSPTNTKMRFDCFKSFQLFLACSVNVAVPGAFFYAVFLVSCWAQKLSEEAQGGQIICLACFCFGGGRGGGGVNKQRVVKLFFPQHNVEGLLFSLAVIVLVVIVGFPPLGPPRENGRCSLCKFLFENHLKTTIRKYKWYYFFIL